MQPQVRLAEIAVVQTAQQICYGQWGLDHLLLWIHATSSAHKASLIRRCRRHWLHGVLAASTVTGLEQPTQDLRLGSQLLLSPAPSSTVPAQLRGSPAAGGAFADGPDAMRLGLRIEQRAGLRQLTRTLQQRLLQASSDLQVGSRSVCRFCHPLLMFLMRYSQIFRAMLVRQR